MNTPTKIVLGSLLSMLLAAGCGKGDAPASSTQASPAIAPVDPASAAKPGACSIAGSWTNGATPPTVLTFNADGSGATESGVAKDELQWKMDGEAFSFHGTKVREGGKLSCQPSQQGRYTLRFSQDCNTVTAVLADDPCAGRAKAMNGMTVKRK